MEQAILIVHVLAALGIIGLILIQQGKGADMGASFGAGGSQTLFGSGGGGNALTQGTAILAAVFFATSFSLAVLAKQSADAIGALDGPIPAVVETPVVAGGEEIPGFDADVVEAAMREQEAAAVSDLDIPEAAATSQDSAPAASEESDIPAI